MGILFVHRAPDGVLAISTHGSFKRILPPDQLKALQQMLESIANNEIYPDTEAAAGDTMRSRCSRFLHAHVTHTHT